MLHPLLHVPSFFLFNGVTSNPSCSLLPTARATSLCPPSPLPFQVLVDLVGVVTEVKPLGSVKRKTDQVELSRRDITLVDQRRAAVHWPVGIGLSVVLQGNNKSLCL